MCVQLSTMGLIITLWHIQQLYIILILKISQNWLTSHHYNYNSNIAWIVKTGWLIFFFDFFFCQPPICLNLVVQVNVQFVQNFPQLSSWDPVNCIFNLWKENHDLLKKIWYRRFGLYFDCILKRRVIIKSYVLPQQKLWFIP